MSCLCARSVLGLFLLLLSLLLPLLLLLLVLLGLLLGLLLLLLVRDLQALKDALLLLLPRLLPLLHLDLVLLELRLQLLENRRDVVRGDGRVQLQLVEQPEGLGVVLDGLLAAALATGLLSTLGLLLGRGGEPELVPLLLLHEHLGALGRVDHLFLLLLLLAGILGLQALAEQDGLLDERDLGHVRLLIKPLGLLHRRPSLGLGLILLPLLGLPLVADAPELRLVSVVSLLRGLELIPDLVPLLDLLTDLLAKLLLLGNDVGKVAQLLLAAVHELRQLGLDRPLLLAQLEHLLVDAVDVPLEPGALVEGLQALLHAVHLGDLGPVALEVLNLLQVLLLFLEADAVSPELELDGRNAVVDLALCVVADRLLHLVQLLAHVLALLNLAAHRLVDLVLLLLQGIHLRAQLVQLSAELALLGKELRLAAVALVDPPRELPLLLVQGIDRLGDLVKLLLELIVVRLQHLGDLLLRLRLLHLLLLLTV
mmetsp:Transcript_18591/g.42147  ORF Transcript_18591/g.42147 Transcript_18591/m.42147 type:complete len:482 (-) Transcript_18591:136-1581(-)